MADVEEVEVVVAHHERATLRVGDVFLKIDTDQTRTDVEVEAMAMAPIPTPEVLWRKPPVLALAALPGTALGRLGEPLTASSAAWAAAGAAARMLHDAPLPPWPGRSLDQIESNLDSECEWLVTNDVLPTDMVTRNRRIAEAALRPWTPVFTHGDLQITHVFVDGDEITGVIDWSEASQGDALYDLASLTLGHEEHLADVVAGYGTHVDLDVIYAWWSLRSLLAARWLIEHGFDPSSPGCEFEVLRSRMRDQRERAIRSCAVRSVWPSCVAGGVPGQAHQRERPSARRRLRHQGDECHHLSLWALIGYAPRRAKQACPSWPFRNLFAVTKGVVSSAAVSAGAERLGNRKCSVCRRPSGSSAARSCRCSSARRSAASRPRRPGGPAGALRAHRGRQGDAGRRPDLRPGRVPRRGSVPRRGHPAGKIVVTV